MTRTVAAVLLLLASCRPSVPAEYGQAMKSAQRAYSAGRYEEAARRFSESEAHAESESDRAEARYRRAVSLERAGRNDAAARDYEALATGPDGGRSARAALSRARLALRVGDDEAATRFLDLVLDRFPASGLAGGALETRIGTLRRDGEARVRSYLNERLQKTTDKPLREHLHRLYADSLERTGDLALARDRYLYMSERFPYPRGRFWDDALFHAAELEARLGRPQEAARLLIRLLSHRESSHWVGSYERPRYSAARFRLAELYRDALGDPARARAEFDKLWRDHPTSRLRDDAKWQVVLMQLEQRDQAGACRSMSALQNEAPASRYVRCAGWVCPTAARSPAQSQCPDYIRREIGQRGRSLN